MNNMFKMDNVPINTIDAVEKYKISSSLKLGSKLRIISESAYFDAMSIIYILAEFIRNRYDGEIIAQTHSSYDSISYNIERNAHGERETIFSTGDYFQYNFSEVHLLAFEHMLSELGAYLLDNQNLWIIDRSLEGTTIKKTIVFDADNKYPEAKKFIDYLFNLQLQKLQKNGKRLIFPEMVCAENYFLESEKQKETKDSNVKVRKIKKPNNKES